MNGARDVHASTAQPPRRGLARSGTLAALLLVAGLCRALPPTPPTAPAASAATPWPMPALQTLAASSLATPTAIAPEAVMAGRRLFSQGQGRDGASVRASAGAGVDLPAGLAACARCHGSSGQGGGEGGLRAPPLAWPLLSQARAPSAGLIGRGAYDEARLLRALREGVDADGRRLSAAMPRFSLEPRAEADLLAFLRALGEGETGDAGVAADTLTLAAVMPFSGPQAARGEAAFGAARACTERANRGGGLYGRRIEWLRVDSASATAAVDADIGSRALAAVAPWWAGLDASALAERLPGLPLIGPLGNALEIEGAPPQVYTVAPQLTDQARIMVDAAVESARPDSTGRALRLALIDAGAAHERLAAQAARRQAALHEGVTLLHWTPGARQPMAAEALHWLNTQQADAAIVLAPPAWLQRMAAAQGEAGRGPLLLASYHGVGRDAAQWPVDLRTRLHLTVAERPPEAGDPLAHEALRAMQQDYAALGLRVAEPALEALAYNAACVTVEALRRAGRQLDRDTLQAAVESIGSLRPGPGPTLSFAPQQRRGVVGSLVVGWDAQGRLQTLRPLRPPLRP